MLCSLWYAAQISSPVSIASQNVRFAAAPIDLTSCVALCDAHYTTQTWASYFISSSKRLEKKLSCRASSVRQESQKQRTDSTWWRNSSYLLYRAAVPREFSFITISNCSQGSPAIELEASCRYGFDKREQNSNTVISSLFIEVLMDANDLSSSGFSGSI